jgi:hypothetical protein
MNPGTTIAPFRIILVPGPAWAEMLELSPTAEILSPEIATA